MTTEPLVDAVYEPRPGTASHYAPKGRGHRQRLLADFPRVGQWHDYVAMGAKSTADNYLRSLGVFCERHAVDPMALVAMDTPARDDLVQTEVQMRAKANHSGDYVKDIVKSVKSWLAFNGQSLRREPRVPRSNLRKTVKDERVPTQEDLRRILDAADPQQRTIIALSAHAGLREEVLGDYEGQNALRLKHLPELEVMGDHVRITRVPMRITVPAELSKNGKSHPTFLGPEGCRYLTAYLNQRASARNAEGSFREVLEPDSPVVRPEQVLLTPEGKPRVLLRRSGIYKAVRTAFIRAGWKGRPYGLRHYFAHRTVKADTKGLPYWMVELFMGHDGGIAHLYKVHKRSQAVAAD